MLIDPLILKGEEPIKLDFGTEKHIIPSYWSFEIRLLIDMLFHTNFFLLILGLSFPYILKTVEFIKIIPYKGTFAEVVYQYPNPVFLTNFAIFSFFFWVLLIKFIVKFLKDKNNN